MATSIYINNNPGNIKYFQSGGKEGVDYYVGSSGIKYRKYDSKAKGLADIIKVMKSFAETDIDAMINRYAGDDKSGTVNPEYAKTLREQYNVLQEVDFDNDEQIKNLMMGVTDLENPPSANKYYTEKDYNDAVKLYRESKLFEGQGTIDEQIKDAEMQGLNLQ